MFTEQSYPVLVEQEVACLGTARMVSLYEVAGRITVAGLMMRPKGNVVVSILDVFADGLAGVRVEYKMDKGCICNLQE